MFNFLSLKANFFEISKWGAILFELSQISKSQTKYKDISNDKR